MSVTIQIAQTQLLQLIEQLQPGEELVITNNGQPIAQMKKTERTSQPCKAGCYPKAEFYMAPDFDAPLEEFKEYME